MCLILQALVCAVAECAVAAVFAAAEIDRARFFGFVRCRCKFRSLVRAVAERLRRALTARAPVVGFASFDFDSDRGFFGDDRSAHK